MRNLLVLLAFLILTSTASAEPRKAYGFKASWCSACSRMYPIWARTGTKVVDADVSDLDDKWGVEVLPSTVIVQDDQVVVILRGVVSAQEINKYLHR